MSTKIADRIFGRPERNVGHTDFATRAIAVAVLAWMVAMLVPQADITRSVIKISLLIGAELGIVLLMLGLFLRGAKTYYAGVQLIFGSLVMLWLNGNQHRWAAITVGVGLAGIGLVNLVTRRSRFNAVMNLSSIRQAIAEVTPAIPQGEAK